MAETGSLCAPEMMEHLTLELWRKWVAINELQMQSVILTLDFDEVSSLTGDCVKGCLVYFLGGVLVGFRPCYVVCDNVAPGDRVHYILRQNFRDANLVVIARQAGSEQYELIGDSKKLQKFQRRWKTLQTVGGWVRGRAFEEAYRMPRNLLEDMYLEGIAIKEPEGQPFYHSVI